MAIKAATRPELFAATAAAVRNADDLVRDAEILAQAHRAARAYSLAALAVEEVGKSAGLAGLAGIPSGLKAQMPVRLMLEWHQFKQAIGLLVAVAPFGPPGVAARLLAMPADDLTRTLIALELPAEETDRLKRGGLYVDIGRGGRLREPSEITEAEVTRQLARARQAADSVKVLLNPGEQARLASAPPEGVVLMRATVHALGEAGYARTPDAAADVITKMVGKLRERVMYMTRRDALAA
jgi:AbiV family abortive infection protein